MQSSAAEQTQIDLIVLLLERSHEQPMSTVQLELDDRLRPLHDAKPECTN